MRHKAIARSRKVHGRHNHSNRRETLYAERQRLYARVSNIRRDHHHHVKTARAQRGGTVKVEPLNISGMARNSRLARAVHDAGIGEYLRMPAYRYDRQGTAFVQIDRWYPSSKTCSHCGARKQGIIALGAHLPLRSLWLRVRPGRERCPEHPGVRHGG